jgi:acetyl-CoA C-acetyltransferase
MGLQFDDVVIVGAARTPIASFGGAFKELSAARLGAIAIAAAIERSSVELAQIDEVIMGNTLQAGQGQNPARQAAIAAGLPKEIPAMTVNHVCGSGLKAIHLAWQAIRSGESEIVVAGGMESMSNAPYLLQGARGGYKIGDQNLVDSMIRDGLWCAFHDYHMGITAENLCARYAFTREMLDQFSYDSQRKAAEAIASGKFEAEIAPVEIPQRRGETLVIRSDEYPRSDTSLEALAMLRPAFRKDGLITAGNSSGINDGAAAVVVMSGRRASRLGLSPLAVIRSNGTSGVEPSIMGIGPVPASLKALGKLGLDLSSIGLIEANEAFAAQSLSFIRELDVNPELMNVNGGAIALGHPIGASGARILVTLLYEMTKRKDVRFGLATLCIGGGQGISTIVERA